MNFLSVGRDKAPLLERLLEQLPEPFLLIDDGPIIDALPFPKHRKDKSAFPKITRFDVNKHHFNPLRNIDDKRARDFIAVLDAAFPEGQNTLTKKNSNHFIHSALLDDRPTKRLDTLLGPNGKDPALIDAYNKLQNILFSPVLRDVLCRAANFSFEGIILARLNRAEIGDFPCRVVGNFLIAQYRGLVCIPDFGFYAKRTEHHTSLIRQERLIAGVNFLDELPEMKNALLLMDKKGSHTTAKDAETLASYAGKIKGTGGYTEFVADSIGG